MHEDSQPPAQMGDSPGRRRNCDRSLSRSPSRTRSVSRERGVSPFRGRSTAGYSKDYGSRRREYSPRRREDYSPRRRHDYSPRRRDYSPRRSDYGRSRDSRYGRSYRSYGYEDGRRSRRPVERGSEEDQQSSTTVFIGNIPYSFTERELTELLSGCGSIRKCNVPQDRQLNRSKGFGFVEFEDRKDAELVMERFADYEVEGRKLRVDWDIGMDKKERLGGRDRGDRRRYSGSRERDSRYD